MIVKLTIGITIGITMVDTNIIVAITIGVVNYCKHDCGELCVCSMHKYWLTILRYDWHHNDYITT